MNSPLSTSSSRRIPCNAGLLELIRSRRESHWKPSPKELQKGFRGWHQRGYLPHFDAPDVIQLVTFMLSDAFPIQRRIEWEAVLHEPDSSLRRRKLEAWLDRGYGECWLGREPIAALVQRVLLQGNQRDYGLVAWCIMANHVHVIVSVWTVSLSHLVQKWKGASAVEANQILGRQGRFWQEDYFDTLVRNDRHLKQAVRYVEENPCKARLALDPRDWRWSSARVRDEWNRLPWEQSTDWNGDLNPVAGPN